MFAQGLICAVDKPDPDGLIIDIRKLLNDSQLRADLVAAGYREALRAHDMRKIRAEYGQYFP
jgi:hypothetical protein